MADIKAAMVKALRQETGLGMMECKKALIEADGDAEAAKDALRAKGMSMARQKAGRETAEGLVAIVSDGASAAMVEVRCETDFCARNDEFKAMVADVAVMALAADEGQVQATDEITSRVRETLARIGENMSYARGVKIVTPRIGTYLHHNAKVGVIVAVDGEIDDQTLTGICQHVAFANPIAITTDDIPQDLVDKEKQIAKQQAMESGKPENIADRIVAGKVNKFLAANALLEQPYVKDDKKKVKDILGGATVKAVVRYAVGEQS